MRLHWLTDGASAVLHLCNAYLSPRLTPQQGSDDIRREIREIEEKVDPGPDWAYETLCKLRKVKIASSTEEKDKVTRKEDGTRERVTEEITTWYTFQNLAEDYFKYLEQAHDRASIMRRSKDIYLPDMEAQIIGFDFKSILQSENEVVPRRFPL